MAAPFKTVRNVFMGASVLALAFVIINPPAPNTNKQEALACGMNSPLSGEIDLDDTIAMFEDSEIQLTDSHMALSGLVDNVVLGSTANSEGKWIEVDLSEQKLKAWEGGNLFLETAISSGLAHTPTPTGEFRVWIKLRSTKMEGGSGKYYYYLPNVPFVMFFANDKVPAYKGYGIHGTYWHNDFGTPRSHGCVNVPTTVAERLYYWTTPNLGEGKYVSRSSTDNPGTRIIIHQ